MGRLNFQRQGKEKGLGHGDLNNTQALQYELLIRLLQAKDKNIQQHTTAWDMEFDKQHLQDGDISSKTEAYRKEL